MSESRDHYGLPHVPPPGPDDPSAADPASDPPQATPSDAAGPVPRARDRHAACGSHSAYGSHAPTPHTSPTPQPMPRPMPGQRPGPPQATDPARRSGRRAAGLAVGAILGAAMFAGIAGRDGDALDTASAPGWGPVDGEVMEAPAQDAVPPAVTKVVVRGLGSARLVVDPGQTSSIDGVNLGVDVGSSVPAEVATVKHDSTDSSALVEVNCAAGCPGPIFLTIDPTLRVWVDGGEGSVDVEGVSGLTVTGSPTDVVARSIGGDLDITTKVGAINVLDWTGDSGYFATTSGQISISSTMSSGPTIRAVTTTGDVSILLPTDSLVEDDITTSGTAVNDHQDGAGLYTGRVIVRSESGDVTVR